MSGKRYVCYWNPHENALFEIIRVAWAFRFEIQTPGLKP